ncbi:hypothetical protein GCM10020227_05540 [Streptomyces flavovirens]
MRMHVQRNGDPISRIGVCPSACGSSSEGCWMNYPGAGQAFRPPWFRARAAEQYGGAGARLAEAEGLHDRS